MKLDNTEGPKEEILSLDRLINFDISKKGRGIGRYFSVKGNGDIVLSQQKSSLLDIFKAIRSQIEKQDHPLEAETYRVLQQKCRVLMNRAIGEEGSFERTVKSICSKVYSILTGDSIENQHDLLQNALSQRLKQGQPPTNNSVELQVRRTPPLGRNDTVVFDGNGQVRSKHPVGTLFQENEIRERLDIIRKQAIQTEPRVEASFTKYGKAIIQQQATRGCTAACSAMLIMDNGKMPDLQAMQNRNLGFDDTMHNDIQAAGLTHIHKETKEGVEGLRQLRDLLLENGSAIVSVGGEIGSHVVVVDAISEDLGQVRLRDPYHGWEITITQEAFLKRWHGGKAIQVQQ